MKIHDISLSISSTLITWPGDPPLFIGRTEKIEEGAAANVTRIDMSAHTGTHVDAPFHFLGNGAVTVDNLQLETLCGKVLVLQIANEVSLITKQNILSAGIPPGVRRLLIKTRNSNFWLNNEKYFQEDYTAIDPECAQHLVEKGIKLVGIDYLSIAPFTDLSLTHKILLEAGVVILEGLNLQFVSPGRYTLICLPLKLQGADGAPARAVLVEN